MSLIAFPQLGDNQNRPHVSQTPQDPNDYFSQARIAERKERRIAEVNHVAPYVGNLAAVATATAIAALHPHPLVRTAGAPIAGMVTKECVESTSQSACNAVVIPAAAKVETAIGAARDNWC